VKLLRYISMLFVLWLWGVVLIVAVLGGTLLLQLVFGAILELVVQPVVQIVITPIIVGALAGALWPVAEAFLKIPEPKIFETALESEERRRGR